MWDSSAQSDTAKERGLCLLSIATIYSRLHSVEMAAAFVTFHGLSPLLILKEICYQHFRWHVKYFGLQVPGGTSTGWDVRICLVQNTFLQCAWLVLPIYNA